MLIVNIVCFMRVNDMGGVQRVQIRIGGRVDKETFP